VVLRVVPIILVFLYSLFFLQVIAVPIDLG
jgi:hypothetical protein